MRQSQVDAGKNNYISPHWDEKNPVGHIRFNDRTGPNGEKIVHIEELQSDWHQKGRQKGYKATDDEKAEQSQVEAGYIEMKTGLDMKLWMR